MAILLLLNVMVVLVGGFGFLFESLEIVFHNLCESCLWLQMSVMCSFHKSCLCCCISLSICVFSALMLGCLWSCCRRAFRWSIRLRMCSGKSLSLLEIFPCGI